MMDKTRIVDHGGSSTVSTMGKVIVKNNGICKTTGSTKISCTSDDFKEEKQTFLSEIVESVELEDIPDDFIFNWDQIGINLVPSSLWTMDKREKGLKLQHFKMNTR